MVEAKDKPETLEPSGTVKIIVTETDEGYSVTSILEDYNEGLSDYSSDLVNEILDNNRLVRVGTDILVHSEGNSGREIRINQKNLAVIETESGDEVDIDDVPPQFEEGVDFESGATFDLSVEEQFRKFAAIVGGEIEDGHRFLGTDGYTVPGIRLRDGSLVVVENLGLDKESTTVEYRSSGNEMSMSLPGTKVANLADYTFHHQIPDDVDMGDYRYAGHARMRTLKQDAWLDDELDEFGEE